MRRDFLHQATAKLVAEHALIAIEDLAVKSMTASAAGTVEALGRNVKAKAGLNRTILRNGWSMDPQMLEYKAVWSGVMLVAAPPAYTSQACGAWGYRENADLDAAKNILANAQSHLGSEIRLRGRPASTAGYAGYAGTYACAGAQRKPRHRKVALSGSRNACRA